MGKKQGKLFEAKSRQSLRRQFAIYIYIYIFIYALTLSAFCIKVKFILIIQGSIFKSVIF